MKSLDELKEQAKIPWDPMTPFKVWCNSAEKLYDQAKLKERTHDIESAYIQYIQFLNIIVDHLPTHKDYPIYKKTATFQDLMDKATECLELVEKLVKKLSLPSNTPSTMKQVVQKDIEKTVEKNTLIEGDIKKIIEVPPLESLDILLNKVTGECIRAELLSEVLKKSPNSVLFLDLRDKASMYPKGPIILFDPLQIKIGIHSNELESLLTANSRSIFQTRETFELIVYFDESSEKVALNPAFQALLNAIYYMEFNKIPKRMPVLLEGGMSAFKKEAASLCQEVPSGQDPLLVDVVASDTAQMGLHEKAYTTNPSVSASFSSILPMKNASFHSSASDKPLAIPYPKLDLKASSNGGIHSGRDHRSFSKDSTLLFPDLSVFQKDSFGHSFPPMLPPKPATPKKQPAALPPATPGSLGMAKLHQTHYSSSLQPGPLQTLPSYAMSRYTSPSPVAMLPMKMPTPIVGPPHLPQAMMPTPVFVSTPTPPSGPKPSHSARSHSFQSTLEYSAHQFDPLRSSPNPSDILNDSLMSSSLSLLSFSALGPSSNGITGLKNLGNTCFMNSIIQCISATLPLTRYFLGGVFRKHINKTNNMGTGGLLAEAYWELLRAMWSGEFTFFSPAKFKVSALPRTWALMSLFDLVGLCKEAVCKFAPRFQGNDQQDSQEFMAFFLDGLHEDLNWVTLKPTCQDPDDDKLDDHTLSDIAWNNYLQRNFSVVVSLFQGQLRSQVRCSTCGKVSTTFNTFMYLSLPLPAPDQRDGGPMNLNALLSHFTSEELLDDSNSWHCPTCKAPRAAIKKLDLWRLPQILIIHFKRFSYQGPFRDKLETEVQFPLFGLDMSWMVKHIPNSKDQHLYDLYAISNHYGTVHGGHYKATCYLEPRQKWYGFDDSRVSVYTEPQIREKAAYILFYKRRKTPKL